MTTHDAEHVAARPRVYDAFMFFNELDVLEIRLRELYDVVDRFIIVEATTTHSGLPKELTFERHRGRFREFTPKIAYEPVTLSELGVPVAASPWEREQAQRDHIRRSVLSLGARPDDLLIVSDADEVPRAETVRTYRAELGLRKLDMDLFYYFLNLRLVSQRWGGAFIVPVGRADVSLTKIRHSPAPCLPDAGWHFSYLGGVEAIQGKLRSFAHAELNVPRFTDEAHIRHCLACHADLFGRGGEFEIIEVSQPLLPACVVRDRTAYRHLLT